MPERFKTARQWCEEEIDDMADTYGLSPQQAAADVLQFLREGQYREQLSDKQTAACVAYMGKRGAK